MENIKILLIEDNLRFAESVKQFLSASDLSHTIVIKSSAEDALPLLNDYRPDLILMDISLPGMNGFEAAKHIRKKYNSIKIFMLTLFNNDEYRLSAEKYGADGFLCKSDFGDSSTEIFYSIINKAG